MAGTGLNRQEVRRDRSVRVAAIAAIVGLGTYIGGWLVAGLLLSGVALVAFGPALDRGLPGTGRLGPLLVVTWRLRADAPRLAAWSLALGALAVTGFAVRYLGVVPRWPGAQQRLFNTVADLWYVLVAAHLLRREVSWG